MEQDLRGDFMRWWTHLYMGENASRNRVSILEGMRKGKMSLAVINANSIILIFKNSDAKVNT